MNASVKASAIPQHPEVAANMQAQVPALNQNGAAPPAGAQAQELGQEPAGDGSFWGQSGDVEDPNPTPNDDLGGQQQPPQEPQQQAPQQQAQAPQQQGQQPQQTPQQQQQGQQPPAPTQLTPEQFQQMENQVLDHLEKEVYALDEDTRKKLISEPDTVIPRLAARMHSQLLKGVIPMILQQIPGIVNQQVEGRLKAYKSEQGFFAKYPYLADPRFRTDVVESLKIVRQMKPNATQEEIMEEGAQLAAFRLSKKYPQQQQGAPQPQQQRGFRPPGTQGGNRPAPSGPNAQPSGDYMKDQGVDGDWW